MSSDFINPIGARSPRLNQAGPVTPQRAVTAAPQAETANRTAVSTPTEGFRPTSEAKETLSDQKAGEAKASEILGAWSNGPTSNVANAGKISVEGAQNTNVNQVHGTGPGGYQASNGPKPGFTAGTVYSGRPQ